MTERKRLKAIRRRKEVKRKRNIRRNNKSVNPWHLGFVPFKRQRSGYRLYQI